MVQNGISLESHTSTRRRVYKPNNLQKTLALLTPSERRRGIFVLIIVVAMALVETLGVASVLPFLSVLGNPSMVEQNEYLATAYRLGRFTSTSDFLFALGLTAFILVIGSSLLRAFTQYVMIRFTTMRAHSLSSRLLRGYVRLPYSFFLQRNSAELGKTLLSETHQVVSNTFQPAMQIIAYGTVILALVTLLIAANPGVALVVALSVGSAYLVIILSVGKWLSKIGTIRHESNRERYKSSIEVLGGIKDLKVLGREELYLRRFDRASTRYARSQATKQTLSQVPRYLIEAIAFGGIIGLALTLMLTRQDLGDIIPILGLYAFTGYRLLPAAQQVYAGLGSLRFGVPAVDAIYADLEESARSPIPADCDPTGLPFADRIHFESVTFTYDASLPPVLHGVDLKIRKNTTVGFVGTTGAGKTTMVDLLMGLLEPTSGQILIDDTPLTTDNIRTWQSMIGYVPQAIYLADASVAENIAFGIEPSEIDYAAVERAARIANIHHFVATELPQGYATVVGERGVRLSGGQRQRIGIARALYHDPSVVVFDEATSALDNATEAAIMAAVKQLNRQKTIVIVAHRLTTVAEADEIVVFEHGQIVAKGDYSSLKETSEAFRALTLI